MRSDSSQCGAAAADNLDEAARRGQQQDAIDESSPANITWASYDVDQATRDKVENIQASINGERRAKGQQPTRIKHLEQAGDADSRKRGESSGHLTEGVRAIGRGFGKGRATEGFAATCPLGSRVPPHVKLEPAWLGTPVADFI